MGTLDPPRQFLASLRHLLPEGRTLPDDVWESRHRALLAVLCLHIVGLPIFGAFQGYDPVHSIGHGAVLLGAAVPAFFLKGNRRLAAALVSLGLVSSSALLVHIWGGVIEGHFHFFVMIVVLSLYEDWVPFLLAAAYVVVHHGVTGVIDPGAVYNHGDAVAHPWKWALIHGLFVTAAGIASVAAWRLNEGVRAETKRAYRQARESEERFKSAFEEAPIGMTMASIDPADPGRFLQVNRAMCEMIGYSERELVGMSFREITHPDDVEKSRHLMKRLVNGEASSIRTDKRYIHADGRVVWGDLSVSLLRDDSGAPLHTIAQIQDITERRRAEREIEEHKDRLQALLDNAPALVYAKDQEGRFLFINRRAETIFHLDAGETVGKTDHDLFPKQVADEFRAHDREVLAYGRPIEYEEIAPQDDGPHVYQTVKFPLRDSAGVPYAVCGISTDVTERKQIEEELERKREAERGSQAKSEFLSRVSHELRTPLNAILGFAQLLELDDLDASQRDSVKHITKGGRHLLELINELLDISRIEAGNMSISLEPVHLRTVLNSVIDLVRPLAAERQVTIGMDLDGDDLFVQADHQRLRQVLLNLLSNAVKYNREGGTAAVSADSTRAGRLRILITDTGPGIRAEDLSKLFSPFQRLGAERGSIEGTGLGLALSKLLVEAMEGTLEVETETGVGTTFVVELARAEPPTAVEPVHAAGNGRSALEQSNGRQTVLHVEDNLSNLQLVEQAIGGRETIQLLSATDGSEGLRVARQHHPDLVLLDLHLPGLSGQEVLDELKRDPETRDIPVVIVSADATPRRIDELLEHGARAFLTKPLDIRNFIQVVDESLAQEAHA